MILRNGKKKALFLGASKVIITDLKKEFIDNYVLKRLWQMRSMKTGICCGTAFGKTINSEDPD